MATAKKATAKRAPAKKAPAKKTPAKKTPAKKTSAKKTAAKKTAAKKSSAKKIAHTKRGLAQDRRQVSAGQTSEVYYEAKKMGVSTAAVKKAIKRVGNERKDIEAELTKPKKKAAAKKSSRGLAQDRRQVAANQTGEVYYEAKKMGVSKEAVKKAIKKVGNDRVDIEVELKKNGSKTAKSRKK